MTKKDYVALAHALQDARGHSSAREWNQGVDEAAQEIARVLAADNGRFDRDRFLSAAGVK
jgi:hypothetical protein